MSSKLELERKLDEIPITPYKPVADLREAHRLLHKSAEINENVQYFFTSRTSLEEIRIFAESIKPTNLQKALELVDLIQDEMIDSGYPEGSGLVLKLLRRIYRDHYPPEKINHNL